MTFAIDTGTASSAFDAFHMDRVQGIRDAVLDRIGQDATQAQIDDKTAQVIIGELRAPKTLDTVRRRLLQLWPLIAPMANSYPGGFDEILTEYAERAVSFD